MTVDFTANRTEIKKVLSFMKKHVPHVVESGTLKISVLPTEIEINAQGISRRIPAITEGLADIHIPARILLGYVSAMKIPEISVSVSDGEMRCGTASFTSPHIKLFTFLSTEENPIPINADDFTILRLCRDKDDTWIAKNEADQLYDNAKRKLKDNLLKVEKILKQYRVTQDDLYALLQMKFSEYE